MNQNSHLAGIMADLFLVTPNDLRDGQC